MVLDTLEYCGMYVWIGEGGMGVRGVWWAV